MDIIKHIRHLMAKIPMMIRLVILIPTVLVYEVFEHKYILPLLSDIDIIPDSLFHYSEVTLFTLAVFALFYLFFYGPIKRSYKQTVNANEMKQQVLSRLDTAVIGGDLSGKITYHSHRASELLGYQHGELTDMEVTGILKPQDKGVHSLDYLLGHLAADRGG